MPKRLNGRLIFTYAAPKINSNRLEVKLKLSLLTALIGIFLLPNLAWLSPITPETLIELTNRERIQTGLNPLTANQLLTRAAALKAQAILNSQTFAHAIGAKKFSAWIRDAGYNYSFAGENLAIDFSTSEGVMSAWDNSPAHKENLLNPYYREIGVAALNGNFNGQETTVIAQVFGAPASAAAAPLTAAREIKNQNLNSAYPPAGLADYYFFQPENFITHATGLSELTEAAGAKLLALQPEVKSGQAYNFFAQLKTSQKIYNFLTVYFSLALAGLLIFFCFGLFSRVNKLGSY